MAELEVNGVTLCYRDEGPRDAPVLVMSHSLFFDHRMFDHQVAGLSDRYRIIRYDLRDQGGSSRSDLPLVDMDTHAADAAALIEALNIAPCFFAGNSMGGFVALRLAARRPDLLAGCIVMGSSGEAEHRFEDFRPLIEGVREQGTGPFIDTLMHIMFGDDYLADPQKADERNQWRRHMLDLGADIARSADGVIRRAGILDELEGCTVPMLILAGAQDHAYPPELSRHIAAVVASARVEVVPGAGHSVALESPGAVNQALAGFMQGR